MSLTTPKTTGTTTITYVVMSVLNRLRDYSMRHYSFLEQIIIEGYSDLNLWHLDNIEVVYLRMSDAKTVDLPADFVDWLRIGVPMGGKLRVLTNHKQILFPRTFADGAPVGNTDDDSGSGEFMYFTDHFRNGQFIGGLYGLSGGVDQAFYRIDREMRTIIFSGSIPRAEIVLEYISTGIKLQGTTVIPREAVSALRAFALWQLIENDSKVSATEKERKKDQYEEQVHALDFFQSAFTKEEYLRHVWKHTKQTAKR
ncbi:MAG: hypothetical protein DRI97_01225 [Bacteroidetes bacterium]|nr:MAG: hypothetical protein DRI97_01225 [Bacteroidota bacterium]